MTYDERLDGIRSYDLAIKEARRRMLQPTPEKLWEAIKTLRDHGHVVTHIEGDGICALWNIDSLRKVGYFEVWRRAHTIRTQRRYKPVDAEEPDYRPTLKQEWPDLPKDAFR